MNEQNSRKLYDALSKEYDMGTYDQFSRDIQDDGKRRKLYDAIKGEYDLPDFDGFSNQLGIVGGVVEPQYGSKGTIDDAPQYISPKEPKMVEYQTRAGDTVRVDTIRPRPDGKEGAAIIEVEKPRVQVAGDTSAVSKSRATTMTKESLSDYYSLEPDAGGVMSFGWQRGSLVSQLDKNGLWLQRASGGYENEAYQKAEKDAEGMSDEQLIAAFNKLSGVIPKEQAQRDALAGLAEGYEDASVLRAYARELRMRDLGYEHANQAQRGDYHYRAARTDAAVASEIDAIEGMTVDQREERLSEALRRLDSLRSKQRMGLLTEKDKLNLDMAQRTIAAATAIYAKEHKMLPEEAYYEVLAGSHGSKEEMLESDLEAAYAERERLQKEMNRRGSEVAATMSGNRFVPGAGAAIDPNSMALLNDDEFNMYRAAMRANDRRIKALERERDNDGFWSTVGQTLFSADTWDFGAQELFEASTTLLHGDKQYDGEKEKARRAMLEHKLQEQAANQQWGENDTFMQRAGEITANAIPFVVQFLATGGFESVTELGTKLGSKAAAKFATGKVGEWILKNTGTFAGDMAAGFLMANTAGGMQTGSDILGRHQGYVALDGKGNYYFRDGKDWLTSVYEGEMANTLEYYTEKLGVHLDGLGKVFSGLSGKGMERIGAGRVSRLFSRITGSEWSKATGNILRKGGIQDYPGEVMEEEANLIMNALLVGDNNFSIEPESEDFKRSVFNPETQADIWGGMMLSIGFMQSPGIVGGAYQTGQYYRYKHKTEDSALIADYRLTTEVWKPWRDRIDNTTNEDMKVVVTDLLADKDLHREEKRAVLNYIGNLMQMRGYNLRTTADAKDKINGTDENGNPTSTDQNDDTTSQSYADGYNMEDDEEMQDAKNRMDLAREALAGIVGGEYVIEQVESDPMKVLSALRSNEQWSDDEKQKVLDYVNALSTYNGMIQRVRDDIDSEIALSDEMINSRIATEEQGGDGKIHPATLKTDDRQVYIISGNVQMADDNTVDIDNSTKDLIIVDAETGKVEFANIHDIKATGDVLDAEQVREEAREAIRQRVAGEAAARIEGSLPFNVGDVYQLPYNGEYHSYRIVGEVNQDTVSVIVDGAEEPVEMPKERLQRMANEKARARVDNEAPQQGQAPAPTQPTTPTAPTTQPQTFALDDELTLRIGDTNVRAWVTAEANGDGQIEVETEEPVNGKVIHLFTAEELTNMLASPDNSQQQPPQQAGQQPPQRGEEEQLIHDAITGLAEGLRESAGQATAIRERDLNEWLQRDEIANALREYGNGAGSVDELVQRVMDDNPSDDVAAAMGDILRFDSSRNIVEGYLSPSEQATDSSVDPMPIGGDGKKDYRAAGAARTARHIYDELGLSPEKADKVVANNIKEADDALKKANKAAAKVGDKITDPDEMAEAERKAQEAIAEAEATKKFWEDVKARRAASVAAEREREQAEQAERDRIAHEQAVAQAEAEREARQKAEAARAAVGNENPMPAIAEKWQNARKVYGREQTIVLPNGERVRGRWVLHESGATTPSHNSVTWEPTEGFPMDKNNNTVNDRDYRGDKDAQQHVEGISRTIDRRAWQTPVMVSREHGITMSGNGRTIAREIAARNGTDGQYVADLMEDAPMFSFTPEDVASFEHPTLSFEIEESMPYTAETFAKFNQQEMKSQNKTEQAVKLGKTVSDDIFKKIVRTINGYDTLGEFYADAEASLGAVYALHNAGVIPMAQLAEMIDGARGNEKLSAVGREFLENLLLGKAFEGEPDVVRMLTEVPAMRQSVITALGEIADNIALGGTWTLSNELVDAVKLCYDALNHGAKNGEIVSLYARQGVLFADPDDLQTAADYNNATMLMLADVLNDRRVTMLKTVLALYNGQARESASGQRDMFYGGDVRSREEILKSVINYFNEKYGRKKELEEARRKAAELRKAESQQSGGENEGVQQDGAASPVADGGGEASEQGGQVEIPKPLPRPEIPDVKPEDMSDEAIAEELQRLQYDALQPATVESVMSRRVKLLAEQRRRAQEQESRGSKKIRGRRQVEKGLERAREAFSEAEAIASGYDFNILETMDDPNTDKETRKQAEKLHKLIMEVINQLHTIIENARKGDDGAITKDEMDWVEEVARGLDNMGYSIAYDAIAVGKMYNDGMKAIAKFVEDDTLPVGTRVIKTVSKPQINKDGVLVQTAEIEVAQNLPEETNETHNNYTIEPAQYTTKRGKVLDMQLVKFGRELTKEEKQALTKFARENNGWWDKDRGGFMMRDEATARQLGEMLGDSQPLSLGDMAAVNDGATLNEVSENVDGTGLALGEPTGQNESDESGSGVPQYDGDREDNVYIETLGKLRALLDSPGTIPNIKAIEKKIRELKTSKENLENGLATASGETVQKGMDTLANVTGQLRAYEQFLKDLRKKMRETERDQVLAEHGVKIGDKVTYKGKPATIYDVDNGKPVLDTGMSPVIYELVEWSDISKVPSSESTAEVRESMIDNMAKAFAEDMALVGTLDVNDAETIENVFTQEAEAWMAQNVEEFDDERTQDFLKSFWAKGDEQRAIVQEIINRVRAIADERKPKGDFKVGDRVFMENVEHEVVGVNADGTLQLKTTTVGIDVTHNSVNPNDVRRPGSEASISYYYEQFKTHIQQTNMTEEQISEALNKVEEMIDNAARVVKGRDMSTLEAEKMARLLGMRKALTEAIDSRAGTNAGVSKPTSQTEPATSEHDGTRAMELFATINEGDVFSNDTGLVVTIDKKVDSKKNHALRVVWVQHVEDSQDGRGVRIFNPLHFMQWAEENSLKKQEQDGDGAGGKGNYGADNVLVSQARYEELKKRMRKKLGGQANMGIDPEILSIGTEMAVYHIEAGARKFSDFAKRMIADLGDVIRPYLKSFYNAVRDMPEAANAGLTEQMDDYESVRMFDVANFDKPTVDAMAAADEIVKENEVAQQEDEAKKKLTDQRNDGRKEGERDAQEPKEAVDGTPLRKATEEDFKDKSPIVYTSDGKPHNVAVVTHKGEQTDSGQFTAPRIERVYLANGESYKLEDLWVADETKASAPQQGTGKASEEDVAAIKNLLNGGKKKKSVGSNKSEENILTSPRQKSIFDEQEQEENNSSNEKSDVQPRTPERGRERHNQEPHGTLGESAGDEVARPNGGRVGGRDSAHTGTDTGRGSGLPRVSEGEQRIEDKRNQNNNHAERGKDYAPKSVDARIEANIAAIELMQELMSSGRPATAKEMAVLRKFSGWGGLGKAFNDSAWGWQEDAPPARLRKLLGEEGYEQANMSRNSAFYTPASIIDALWDIARSLGFKGGKVLEGSAGIGNILGLMPQDMSERSDIHAVEIDSTTGGILSLLYPDANVDIQGFEETRIPNGSVDLAITNVPFVSGLRVKDETGDGDLSRKFRDIHDFCIAKNIRKLREGGIGIFITSSGTLDNSQKLRDWIVSEGGADVVGVFRLNNDTFGGAGVTSDIIVVRKRVNGKKSAHAIDVSTVTGERTATYETGETKKVKGQYVPVTQQLSMDYNKYFVEHPEMMGGEMAFGFEMGDSYRPTSKGLFPKRGINQDQRLADFVRSFADFDDEVVDPTEISDEQSSVYEELGDDIKEGSMLIDSNGKLCVASYGRAVPLDVNSNKVKGHTKQECFRAYAAIKKAVEEVLTYQTENDNDSGLQPLLDRLNKVFDDFVNTYGHFHKNPAISFLRSDMDFSSIAALESVREFNDDSGKRKAEFTKSDIFTKRVVEKESDPKPKTVKDGVITSLYKFGRIDIPYISEQLGISESDAKRTIIESGLGFENPLSCEVEVSYEYLSGNVREKLQQAREANENGEYNVNIKALEAVIPMDIPSHLIEFSLGSSWLDPKLYVAYIKERTGLDVSVANIGGTWIVNEPYYVSNEQNRAMGVNSKMCDRIVWGHELIAAAMQNRTIRVTKTVTHGSGSYKTTETIFDKEATQACNAKIDEIRQDFRDWARERMQGDPELSEQIEREYNERFNNYVPKEIPDTFVPEYFGGASHAIRLRAHQAKAAIRGTTQPLMLAHEVGTGKTFTLITTAMEMRRLGTARKPMIVVQNATVGQFVASAKSLYPNAKILTLEDADRTAEGRKAFYAKIKYNDWDMIVIPQSAFEMIPDSEERQMAFIRDKIEEKLMVLDQMRDAGVNDSEIRRAEKEIDKLNEELSTKTGEASEKRKKRDAKKEAIAKQNAAVRAREMLDRRVDDVENFDEMGIDAILVDEAHEYKHLGFATAMQRGVKGIDPSYSKKSQGVYLKCQSVLERTGGKNVIFATGTPISNTAAEIWTFMRYLMPADVMREYGIYYFDDFVRNFGNLTQMLEFATSGKFKEVNRFSGYVNLPELVRIWSGVSDTVLTDEAGNLKDKIPELEGGKATDIYLPQTRALRSVMKFVIKELNRFESMSGKEKKQNSHIPLTMYGIAKAAAVDARLVLADAEDEPNSKTNEAVRQTLRSLEETEDYRGTVAIFADVYQNKETGFNLYEDIRQKLIESGVPAEQIVVMKSGMSIKQKLEIFDKVNSGEVRVILGSTFTLGTGVNIQERLHTLIHLDAPNRPMDYTQRNGRILRQGNIHKNMGKPVRILRFGVEDSLDVTAYQRLKTKGAIADSIMHGRQLMSDSMENRTMEEEEDVFGDTVAQLSGSEFAMLKQQAEREVRRLRAKQKQYESDQIYIHNQKPRLAGQISASRKLIEDSRRVLQLVESADLSKGITIGKQHFATVEAMVDFFKEYNKKLNEISDKIRGSYMDGQGLSELTVSIGGFDFKFRTELKKETERSGGSLKTVVRKKMTYSCDALGIDGTPVERGLLRNGIEDILNDVLTGNDFRERIEASQRSIARNEEQLAILNERDGKPFEFAEELAAAEDRLEDYEKKMKAELEAKEAKYAEIDAEVETASPISADDESEDSPDANMYREDDDDLLFSDDPTVQENIENGLNALKRLAAGEDEVGDAMRRDELAELGGTAEIAFIWGSQGRLTKSGRYKGGEGFLKIIEKHGIDDAIKVVETIAKGDIGEPYGVEGGQRVDIDFRDHHTTVSLFRHGNSKSWVLTAYTIDSNTDAKGRGSDLSNATQSDPIRTRAELGAALKSVANLQRIFGIPNESAENNATDAGADYREVTDEEQIAWLESQPKMRKLYRAMVLIDGKLYPPMSSKDNETGELRNPERIGHWTESQERPDLAVYDPKTGKWYFRLLKSDGSSIDKVLYNPYIHTSTTMLNDQFKAAQSRPDLVVVEMEVPISELEGTYRAERAADPTGRKPWNAGVIQKYLTGTRDVILSRWAKPVRIVPNDEVARHIFSMIDGHISVMPTNVVTPQVRAELEKLGVKFVETDNKGNLVGGAHAGESWTDVYGARNKRAKRGKKPTRADRTRAMHERAIELGEKLGVKVRLIESRSELPQQWTERQKRRRKGWYDTVTGEVVIVVPNNNSVADVEATVLHEIVGHKGLRELFGKDFDTFLDNVYANADAGIRREIARMAIEEYGGDFRLATEEYLARLAEVTDFDNPQNYPFWHTFWNNVKGFLLDMLRKVGIEILGGISDSDLQYILWRSYQHRLDKGAMGVAEDVVMRDKLGIDSEEDESDGGGGGIGNVAEMMFRDDDFSPRDRAIARDAYERMVSTGGYQFQEAVQDSMLGLKRLYQAVLGKGTRMEDVSANENAYIAENLMSSANAAEQHEYYVRYMKPLLSAIHRLCGSDKAEREAMTNYMMAKHGLERNVVLAERDAQEAAAAGADYNDALTANRERDYAGLTALTGENDVAAAEAVAQQMVDDYETSHDTAELWACVNEATAATLEKIYRSGLISKERYDKIQTMFTHYIPLQGWDETTSDEVYGYLTSKDSPLFGSPIKRAEGRSSKADDPIATIGLMADTAIRQGNRNLMKQRFLNFVLNHPSDAVSVSDIWLQYNAVTDEWEPVFADIEPTDSASDVERKVAAFDARMQQLAANEPDKYKRGRDATDIPYKVVRGNMREHQVLVRRRGRTYVLTINGNPRAAQALNGLTNPDVDTNGVVGNMLRGAQWVNRNLSSLYTTRNPDFVVSNFFRDMLYSNCMTWVKEKPAYALRFHYNFGRVNPFRLRRLLRKWEKGTLDDSKYIERMFKEFMLAGGETGYTNVRDIEGHKRTISRELKRQGSSARRAWKWLVEQLDLLNRAAENCARFAAFLTSREAGRSVERSAYDAKEVSVNFNKKGSGGKMVNAVGQTGLGKLGSYIGGGGRLLYVFWNAGVQGMTNFARAGKRHPAKAFTGAASMFMLGYVIPMLAKAMFDGDDDDENAYYNLPEYVRRSNIVINAGDKWVTIPLPIEFRALYGLGELAYGVISGNERYSNSELAYQIGSQVSQILPIDVLEGGGGVNPWIPSLAKPIVEAYVLNKGWSGLPIYKDTPWNKDDPEWKKAYKSANRYLVIGAQWLNEISGGDDYKKGGIDINPAKVEYLLSGMFGGAFTTIDKLSKMTETAIGDRDFEWRNMLLANRVVKSGDERTAARKLQNEYYKYKDEYEDTKRLLKKYEDEKEAGSIMYAEKLNFLNHSDAYARYTIFENYRPMFEAIREAKNGASDMERDELNSYELGLRREMVNLMHSFENGGKPDSLTSSTKRLDEAFMSDNETIRKKARSAIASRIGGTYSYGSSDAEYNQRYVELSEPMDEKEDVSLQVAKKAAKDAGDDDRYKALEKAQRELTDIKKGKHTKSVDIAGFGEGGDDEAIMARVRSRRREILDEFGIDVPR